jgi:hypothetical protein
MNKSKFTEEQHHRARAFDFDILIHDIARIILHQMRHHENIKQHRQIGATSWLRRSTGHQHLLNEIFLELVVVELVLERECSNHGAPKPPTGLATSSW